MKSVRNLINGILLVAMFIGISSFMRNDYDVFICKGKYSKKYHYRSNCRGLSNCSTKTYKVSISAAKKIGRTLCGWED